MSSVAFALPLTGTVIAASDTGAVVDVVDIDLGESPRTLNIYVNAVAVYTNVDGAQTYLDAGYTAVTTLPTTTSLHVELTRTAPWTDPSWLEFAAQFDHGMTYELASSQNAVATVGITIAHPAFEQADVNATTDLAFTITSSMLLWGAALITINGEVALAPDGNWNPIWNLPDYTGLVQRSSGWLTVTYRISPRKNFDAGSDVVVDVNVAVTPDSERTATTHRTYRFSIAPRLTRLFNPALRQTAVDQPFPNAIASDTFRRVLLATLRPRQSTSSAEVVVYARILRSVLKSIAPMFKRPDLDTEVRRLVAEDFTDVVDVSAHLADIDLLWEPALQEAARVGVDPLLLNLLARTHAAQFPQDRVASVAALVFAMAAQFTP